MLVSLAWEEHKGLNLDLNERQDYLATPAHCPAKLLHSGASFSEDLWSRKSRAGTWDPHLVLQSYQVILIQSVVI